MFKKKWVKVLAVVLGILIGLYLVMFVVNVFCNIGLRKYIESFEPVAYSADRLTPTYEDGYYTYTSDEELNILHITDIHLGGGFWTYKTDKKTIYELITMLQAEKPDLVISTGDNTYALPFFGWNGGNTFNNKMVAKTFISIFEHEKVYFSTVFGNHDTEAWDYADRATIGALYQNGGYEYSIFESQFSDLDCKTVPSVSNQFILVKNSEGKITKLLLLIDSNAYISTSLISNVLGKYDTIHDAEVEWAASVIKELSKKEGLPEGEYLKCLAFMHIPVGEYRCALDDLITEVKDEDGNATEFVTNTNPKETEFVEGAWGEIKICYGGVNDTTIAPEDQDKFFEVLAEDMGCLDAIFCGHDHTNNAVVNYKGVMLSYGYSLDNTAYGKGIKDSGEQRGATLIQVNADGTFTQQHKNAYTDYGCDLNKFSSVYLDKHLYPEQYRTVGN